MSDKSEFDLEFNTSGEDEVINALGDTAALIDISSQAASVGAEELSKYTARLKSLIQAGTATGKAIKDIAKDVKDVFSKLSPEDQSNANIRNIMSRFTSLYTSGEKQAAQNKNTKANEKRKETIRKKKEAAEKARIDKLNKEVASISKEEIKNKVETLSSSVNEEYTEANKENQKITKQLTEETKKNTKAKSKAVNKSKSNNTSYTYENILGQYNLFNRKEWTKEEYKAAGINKKKQGKRYHEPELTPELQERLSGILELSNLYTDDFNFANVKSKNGKLDLSKVKDKQHFVEILARSKLSPNEIKQFIDWFKSNLSNESYKRKPNEFSEGETVTTSHKINPKKNIGAELSSSERFSRGYRKLYTDDKIDQNQNKILASDSFLENKKATIDSLKAAAKIETDTKKLSEINQRIALYEKEYTDLLERNKILKEQQKSSLELITKGQKKSFEYAQNSENADVAKRKQFNPNTSERDIEVEKILKRYNELNRVEYTKKEYDDIGYSNYRRKKSPLYHEETYSSEFETFAKGVLELGKQFDIFRNNAKILAEKGINVPGKDKYKNKEEFMDSLMTSGKSVDQLREVYVSIHSLVQKEDQLLDSLYQESRDKRRSEVQKRENEFDREAAEWANTYAPDTSDLPDEYFKPLVEASENLDTSETLKNIVEFSDTISQEKEQLAKDGQDIDSTVKNVIETTEKLIAQAEEYLKSRKNEDKTNRENRYLETSTNNKDPKTQVVYQGSPYAFNRFDTSNTGRGEGGAAHGVGGYFAKNLDTADHYANKLSQKDFANVYVNGEKVRNTMGGIKKGDELFTQFDKLQEKEYQTLNRLINSTSMEEFLEKVEKDLSSGNKELVNFGKFQQEYIKGKNIQFENKSGQYVYAAQVPADRYLINEDVEVGKLSKKFQEAIKQSLEEMDAGDLFDTKKSFASINSSLTDKLWKKYGDAEGGIYEAKKTEIYNKLSERGVKGISYEGKQPWGEDTSKTDGKCVVIFDDKDIKLLSREDLKTGELVTDLNNLKDTVKKVNNEKPTNDAQKKSSEPKNKKQTDGAKNDGETESLNNAVKKVRESTESLNEEVKKERIVQEKSGEYVKKESDARNVAANTVEEDSKKEHLSRSQLLESFKSTQDELVKLQGEYTEWFNANKANIDAGDKETIRVNRIYRDRIENLSKQQTRQINSLNKLSEAYDKARKSFGTNFKETMRAGASRLESSYTMRYGFIGFLSRAAEKGLQNNVLGNMFKSPVLDDQGNQMLGADGKPMMKGVNVGGAAFGMAAEAVKKLGNAVVDLGKASMSAFGDIQSIKTNLGVVYGSQADADSVYEKIKEYSLKSPFGVKQVSEFAVLLKQSGVYSSELMDTMKQIGDVAGGNQEKFQRIANNYAQIIAANRATSLDLRQFANAGLPIYKEIRKELGISQKEVRQMTQEGKIGANVIEKVFRNMTSEGGTFYQAVNKGAKTYKARMQNLEDQRQVTLAAAGERFYNFDVFQDILDVTEKGLKVIEDWFDDWTTDVKLDKQEDIDTTVFELQKKLEDTEDEDTRKVLQDTINKIQGKGMSSDEVLSLKAKRWNEAEKDYTEELEWKESFDQFLKEYEQVQLTGTEEQKDAFKTVLDEVYGVNYEKGAAYLALGEQMVEGGLALAGVGGKVAVSGGVNPYTLAAGGGIMAIGGGSVWAGSKLMASGYDYLNPDKGNEQSIKEASDKMASMFMSDEFIAAMTLRSRAAVQGATDSIDKNQKLQGSVSSLNEVFGDLYRSTKAYREEQDKLNQQQLAEGRKLKALEEFMNVNPETKDWAKKIVETQEWKQAKSPQEAMELLYKFIGTDGFDKINVDTSTWKQDKIGNVGKGSYKLGDSEQFNQTKKELQENVSITKVIQADLLKNNPELLNDDTVAKAVEAINALTSYLENPEVANKYLKINLETSKSDLLDKYKQEFMLSTNGKSMGNAGYGVGETGLYGHVSSEELYREFNKQIGNKSTEIGYSFIDENGNLYTVDLKHKKKYGSKKQEINKGKVITHDASYLDSDDGYDTTEYVYTHSQGTNGDTKKKIDEKASQNIKKQSIDFVLKHPELYDYEQLWMTGANYQIDKLNKLKDDLGNDNPMTKIIDMILSNWGGVLVDNHKIEAIADENARKYLPFWKRLLTDVIGIPQLAWENGQITSGKQALDYQQANMRRAANESIIKSLMVNDNYSMRDISSGYFNRYQDQLDKVNEQLEFNAQAINDSSSAYDTLMAEYVSVLSDFGVSFEDYMNLPESERGAYADTLSEISAPFEESLKIIKDNTDALYDERSVLLKNKESLDKNTEKIISQDGTIGRGLGRGENVNQIKTYKTLTDMAMSTKTSAATTRALSDNLSSSLDVLQTLYAASVTRQEDPSVFFDEEYAGKLGYNTRDVNDLTNLLNAFSMKIGEDGKWTELTAARLEELIKLTQRQVTMADSLASIKEDVKTLKDSIANSKASVLFATGNAKELGGLTVDETQNIIPSAVKVGKAYAEIIDKNFNEISEEFFTKLTTDGSESLKKEVTDIINNQIKEAGTKKETKKETGNVTQNEVKKYAGLFDVINEALRNEQKIDSTVTTLSAKKSRQINRQSIPLNAQREIDAKLSATPINIDGNEVSSLDKALELLNAREKEYDVTVVENDISNFTDALYQFIEIIKAYGEDIDNIRKKTIQEQQASVTLQAARDSDAMSSFSMSGMLSYITGNSDTMFGNGMGNTPYQQKIMKDLGFDPSTGTWKDFTDSDLSPYQNMYGLSEETVNNLKNWTNTDKDGNWEVGQKERDAAVKEIEQRKELMENAANAFKNVWGSTVDAISSGLTETFTMIGENMRDMTNSAEDFEDAWKEIGKNMLASVGAALTQTGLSIAASAATEKKWALVGQGLAMAAGGGVASIAAGILTDSDDDSDKDEQQKINNLKDALADLIDQAKTDAEYYEANLRHKNALASIDKVQTRSVSDAIITPSGNVITTHPDDYLIATKTPDTLVGNRENGNGTVVNFTVVNNSANVQVQEQRTQNDDGSVDIVATIIDVVNSGLASGQLNDGMMAYEYNQQGRTVAN